MLGKVRHVNPDLGCKGASQLFGGTVAPGSATGWIYAEQDRASQWIEITAASFPLENIFEDFKVFMMRRFVARAW